MMNPTQGKVLLAIDGSDQSMDAVRYASNVLNSENTEVALFHVMRTIDKAFWDIGINPAFRERIANIRAWDTGQRKTAEKFMNRARQILFNGGFAPGAVKLKIHQSKVGVARDITEESKNGYSAIILGRKGLSKLKDLVLGSIAHKLVQKLTRVPVWVVGGKPHPGKLLLALDASAGAMKAVDHVGAMLGSSNVDVTLLHVIRGISTFGVEQGYAHISLSEEEKWLEKEKLETESIFDEARICLINAGFDSRHVNTKLVTGVRSRAGAIVEEAKEGGYGTIVVGRRGISKVEDFFAGGVSNKVMHLAKEMAVWVVS